MITGKTLNKLTPEATINQIISSYRNAAKLLNSIGMKPEQHRDQTLRSVCQQRQWNEEELLRWIKKNHAKPECIKSVPENPDFKEDLSHWCSWLSKSIQPCIPELLSDIENDLPRVQLVHGNQYTWLKDIEWHFYKLNEQLKRYFFLEKGTLYPLAIELNDRRESILYGKVKDLIRSLEILESDHPKILKEMNKIEKYSDGFRHPAGACSTLRIMNENLADLSAQLKNYFSIEQEKLFPLIKGQLHSK
jgi:iron-sulfur cluster repair protein YtfE (RIC family)